MIVDTVGSEMLFVPLVGLWFCLIVVFGLCLHFEFVPIPLKRLVPAQPNCITKRCSCCCSCISRCKMKGSRGRNKIA